MKTFSPVNAVVLFDDGVPIAERPLYATIESVRQYAGAAIGSALVSYPANRPDNPAASMGVRARIKIGNTFLFSGIVGSTPVEVGGSSDSMQLIMFDDKFLLQTRNIGQIGIGSDIVNGFPDVGFNVVFNANGRPNKDPSELTFCTGSGAVYWTLRDVLNFVFAWYVDSSVATVAAAEIAHSAWAAVPSHVNLLGQNALQAIDAIAEIAGESWALIPSAAASTYRSVREGNGTQRLAGEFRPNAEASVEGAGEGHPSETRVGASIQNCRDVYQAVSAPILKECGYTNKGMNPLLARVTAAKDKEYADGARFQADVTKYNAWNLGSNLSAGSPPKPWSGQLVTRLKADGSGYVTKAEMTADPLLANNKRAAISVWVSADGTDGNLKLVTGGYRIDTDKATIDFKTTLEIASATPGGTAETLEVSSWSTAKVLLAVATVLELPEDYTTTASTGAYLVSPMTQMISKPDLVPERRQNLYLPDLSSSDAHAISSPSTGGIEEKYVSVTTRLFDAAMGALRRSPSIETPIDILLELFPLWNVGDRLVLVGRNLGQTGDEVITEIEYGIHHQYETRVKASNLMASVDPEKFVRHRR